MTEIDKGCEFDENTMILAVYNKEQNEECSNKKVKPLGAINTKSLVRRLIFII